MTVSIIIPSYRQPHFLSRAIESCLEQDHTDIEVIVVEDRSRDSSLGLALSYRATDERVRVVECVANGGLGKARNVGVAHATGEYLCFLDSDDYLLAGSLSARIAAIPAASAQYGDRFAGVYGDWQHVSEAVDYPTVRAPRSNMTVVSSETYTGENVFICSAPLVERRAVLDAGGFPEGLPMLEDFALWAKIIAGGGVFVPVEHVVATYRQRANSMLRGDGAVVMADYVDVINQWATNAGISLADGGAMDAWLDDQTPYSFGRLSWTSPSTLGSFGGSAGASAIFRADEQESAADKAAIADFMTTSARVGFDSPSPIWAPVASAQPTMRVVVHSVSDSIAACGIAAEVGPSGIQIASSDPTGWSNLWPLALAGLDVVGLDAPVPGRVVDLAVDTDGRSERIAKGVAELWPDVEERAGSVVYVPRSLVDYPALDAWVATALHALSEAGLEPKLMCAPELRESLIGFRSQLLDCQQLQKTALVVTTVGEHLELIEALAPTVTFSPSAREGTQSRTRAQLDDAIRARRVIVGV